MKIKYLIFLLISFILVIVMFSILSWITSNNSWESPDKIGGQTDEHGCLGPAGYSWNDDVNACIRNWELNDEQKNASKVATSHLSFPVTIIEVNKLDGEGNYALKIQRNDNREILNVMISNWTSAYDYIEVKKNYCTDEQKNATICTMEYHAVCGYFTLARCHLGYSCAETFSNPCIACQNSKVKYWTEGECPLN